MGLDEALSCLVVQNDVENLLSKLCQANAKTSEKYPLAQRPKQSKREKTPYENYLELTPQTHDESHDFEAFETTHAPAAIRHLKIKPKWAYSSLLSNHKSKP